jgi:hypothetical protein
MSHPLVLGLFDDAASAARGAALLRELGVAREHLSIVARSRDAEGVLAAVSDATPGSEIEESLPASRLGELGAHVLAAVALVMPGIGPIVADGPLTTVFAEMAGHIGGDVRQALERAGIASADAEQWDSRIRKGAFLVGAHVDPGQVAEATDGLSRAGAAGVLLGSWPD